MSEQDGESPTIDPEPENDPETTQIIIGAGKSGGDYRFRMTASRSGKISDGNYGNQDAFFAMSAGFDDLCEAVDIARALEDFASLLAHNLKRRVNTEYLEMEGEIRAKWGLGKTPVRTPLPDPQTDLSHTNGTGWKKLDDNGGPKPIGTYDDEVETEMATNTQIRNILEIMQRSKVMNHRVKNFMRAVGNTSGKIKHLTAKQAGDLYLLIEEGKATNGKGR